jgi:hypothetical protein
MSHSAMQRADVTEDVTISPLHLLESYRHIAQLQADLRRLRSQAASAARQLEIPGADWILPALRIDQLKAARRATLAALRTACGRARRRLDALRGIQAAA